MKNAILLFFVVLFPASGLLGQVKIGHEIDKPVQDAAILELSNDPRAEPAQWKGLVLPYVDFSRTDVFLNNTTWGIAGLPVEGTLVYNTADRANDGFKGAGAYVWTLGAWEAVAAKPPRFHFTNCSNPAISGTFVDGEPTSATVTLTYNNGNGSSYPAYTSPTVNGVKLTAPAGTIGNNSGSVVLTASGTPVNPGNMTIPVSIGGSHTCHVAITVQEAPTPPQFINCDNPVITGEFVTGTPTGATVMLYYVNGNGSSYAAYNSPTVNGITLHTPAGTLNNGSGTLYFTASGTPGTAGYTSIPISLAGSWPCNVVVPVQNAPPVPPPGGCTDPGFKVGSTGCVTFTYQGQQVTYQTVRAADGKIWLQHNLGSPQVAYVLDDHASYGHYFQWGRWDDGHQSPESANQTGGETLRNPSHIPSGHPNFVIGATSSTSWWGLGGAATDTWTGTVPTATNGIDPATALGPGWRIPTGAEWTTVIDHENVFDSQTAFNSNLKLTTSGYRNSLDGTVYQDWVGGYYWSRDAAAGNLAKNLFFDEVYNALVQQTGRGFGFPLRFVKD
jgi:hypothetical protein